MIHRSCGAGVEPEARGLAPVRLHFMQTAPHHPLKKVRERINDGEVTIRSNAVQKAWTDFGWGHTEMLAAVTRLNISHFWKTEPSLHVPDTMLDFYKARNLYEGEDVFIHLYISDADRLIINSLYEL
jgi:hypothetical protein